MTTAAPVPASTRPPVAVRKRRALTAAGATLAATGVWLLAQATGTELTVTMAGQPPMTISLPFVVVTALAASLAGWAALAVLQRVARRGRALWTVLAIAALLVSFGPVAAAQTNAAARTLLALMHLAVAAVLIPGLVATVAARRAADPEWRQS
ncbi:MAG TPA: DUF6069 family protein [Jiangellales bacterium]|nr:DUF6069 family protein [Jiangellales bacterium]